MVTNEQIVKGAITTESVTHGLLTPQQAVQFVKQAFEQTALGNLIRHELRMAGKGTIDKIGMGRRIIRKKVEGIDAMGDGSAPVLDPETGQVRGYRAKPHFSAVEYATEAVRLPWEITEETLRQNIEGEGLEATITALMTRAWGLDIEDLSLNGDIEVPGDGPDGRFLYINDGWIKQIAAGGHVYKAAGGAMSLEMFYHGVKSMPNKYNNGNLRWLMSPHRKQQWDLFLLDRAVNGGGNVPEAVFNAPAAIPYVAVPAMPDDKILLADPKNLINVFTYGMKIRKVDNDSRAAMEDKRFYVIHADMDAIIEELDATAIITDIGGSMTKARK